MRSRIVLLKVLLFALLAVSCNGQKKSNTESVSKEMQPIAISHAELFSISKGTDYTSITVFNPWKPGEIYDTYYLVKDKNMQVPVNGHKVTIPINKLMMNSATHIGFLELLGELDKITGVCNSDYIYNPTIREGVKGGSIQDLGDSFNLNIEKLLLLHPEAVMTTAYNADDENSKKMRQTGLTVLYNIEWQEKTLLGRAEWIKFVGAFFDKTEQADSIFRTIEARYNEIKESAASLTDKPTILSGQDFRGSWSMPGGQSFNGELFRDAGGDYFYKDNTSSGSINNTIEEALVHFSKADVWVGVQVNTLEELSKMDRKYQLFKAYKEGNVYNTNKRMNATGGNDYWEGAVARPDLLLNDMIKILHPDLLPKYELTYMQKLN